MFTSDLETIFPIQAKRGRKKRIQEGDKCLVCDGKSVGINFGVHTCSPCKAFFRRNAVKLGKYDFTCPRDGDCSITHTNRRLCNCCRLAKCFRVGMNRNAIRTDDQRLARNRLVELNRQKRFEMNQKIQPVNLLNSSQQTLSSKDQVLLTNIFHAYNQTCISLRDDDVQSLPNDNTLSMKKLMNINSKKYTAFIDFYKLVPEFVKLPVNTKITLLKRNFTQVQRVNSSLTAHATGTVEDTNSLSVRRIFPDDLYCEVCICIQHFFPFVYDPLLLKILFIILIFSSSLSTRNSSEENFIDIQYLLSIQNLYIELFWRYLLYRCANYEKCVQILSTFVGRLLRSQTINSKLRDFVDETMTNQVDQLEPIMRAMWTNENK